MGICSFCNGGTSVYEPLYWGAGIELDTFGRKANALKCSTICLGPSLDILLFLVCDMCHMYFELANNCKELLPVLNYIQFHYYITDSIGTKPFQKNNVKIYLITYILYFQNWHVNINFVLYLYYKT